MKNYQIEHIELALLKLDNFSVGKNKTALDILKSHSNGAVIYCSIHKRTLAQFKKPTSLQG